MLVAGSMIGSGIFLVSAEMSRQLGSSGWLLAAWLLTGLLTIAAALSYGELAAMMPKAGGQYVYLKEAFSPLWGFLYGWTLFLVIQSGTIAAVAIGFARYFGVLSPAIGESQYLIAPIHILPRFAVSLSTAQLVGILLVLLLTATNARGINYGKIIQNLFTSVKLASLFGLLLVGLFLGWNPNAVSVNFTNLWTPTGPEAPQTAFALLVALCVSQTGSLFSADAWNNITFTAGEVKDPRRNLPLSLFLGAGIVILLYLGANLAYLFTLPLPAIQNAPADRVAAAMLEAIFPNAGARIMAVAIMISGFGCINGMALSGARAYFAMALDGLFFNRAARLNSASVPGSSLWLQCLWTCVLILLRTFDPSTGKYGNLYSDLLDYVVSAALLFYILTIAGIFRLRHTRPNAERPYRAFGYPILPALYIALAAAILVILFLYRPATTVPGMIIVLLGVPVYFLFRRGQTPEQLA